MRKSFLLVFSIFIALVLISCGKGKKQNTKKINRLILGTGGQTGIYYPTGVMIADKVKLSSKIDITTQITGGSLLNLNAISKGDMDIGMAQSDLQYQAYFGKGEWKNNPLTNIRAVLSLHYEAVTLIAANDANIKSFEDIKGKRINIGNIGSGQRQNALDLINLFSITLNDFKVENVKASDSPSLLGDKRIDGYFYTVGHPNGNVTTVFEGGRKVNFVPIIVPDQFLKDYPYYAKTFIYQSSYPKYLNEDIETIGVKATLCAREDVDESVIYSITKTVVENLEFFKKQQAVFNGLSQSDLLKGLSIPLHSGAEKYFKEAGLLQ